VVGAVVVLAAGFLVGWSAPWSTDEPAGTARSVPRAAEPIIPPAPPELTDPGRVPPGTEPFGGLADDLRRLFEDGVPLPPDLFDHGEFGFTVDGLVSVPEPPDGYQVGGNTLQISPGEISQRLVLTGPDGDIVVEARRGELPPLAGGEPVTVRGTQGRLSDDGTELRLTWDESTNTRVTITAPGDVGVDTVVALAESLEVTP